MIIWLTFCVIILGDLNANNHGLFVRFSAIFSNFNVKYFALWRQNPFAEHFTDWNSLANLILYKVVYENFLWSTRFTFYRTIELSFSSKGMTKTHNIHSQRMKYWFSDDSEREFCNHFIFPWVIGSSIVAITIFYYLQEIFRLVFSVLEWIRNRCRLFPHCVTDVHWVWHDSWKNVRF